MSKVSFRHLWCWVMKDPDNQAAFRIGSPLGTGGRFTKVPIINGPGKLSPFTLKIGVSLVLHLT